jgi:deoxyribodipyrimidine photo-lyase
MEKMNEKRVRILKEGTAGEGPVAFWMSRDQRAEDNWGLIFAKRQAEERGVALVVVFCLVDDFLGAALRHYDFMLKGLKETAADLLKKNIPFFLLRGQPGEAIPAFCEEHGVGTLVTDFDPLRIKRAWKKEVAERIAVPFYEVDAHNIVPCWLASVKEEYGAYTIRPKLHRQLGEFLEDFPRLKKHSIAWSGKVPAIDWNAVLAGLKVDRTVEAVDWLEPGMKAGKKMLARFIDEKLAEYNTARNDPTVDGLSNLSPYLHFGQISPQRVAWEIQNCKATLAVKEVFLDQLITWRELSDNFCFYNENYDNTGCFANWAKETLDRHRKDRRVPAYDFDTLEKAETHDELWNAAQLEMVRRGKMHGYMRMYWAKKILEWTASPEEAVRTAIYLNDKYEIDGRDPNGYANIAWSIGGVHDHGWRERPIFGKIRYMSYNGAKSKFDIEAYIGRYGHTTAE